MQKISGIYKIENLITKTKYIGQSQDIYSRWYVHKRELNNNSHHNYRLQNDWNVYGENNFDFMIIEECDICQLNNRESYWIREFDSFNNGYNLDLGGLGIRGYKHTKEQIDKMIHIQNPKKVVQLDHDFNVVAEFESCNQVEKQLGFSHRQIKSVCEKINHQKTAHGYFWAYADDYYSDSFDYSYYEIHEYDKRQILQFDLDMNLINTWESNYEASINTNVPTSEISTVCNEKRMTASGFVWRYADSYSNDQFIKDKNTNFHKTKIPHTFRNLKRINQYDSCGKLIATFNSIAEAVRVTGIGKGNIQSVLKNRHKTAGGYLWKYA